MNTFNAILISIFLFSAISTSGHAQITAQEANRLQADLTPIGAERAGNATGTIPEWTGEGITLERTGTHYQNPFEDEEPLFTIDASNVSQYRENLTPGQLALLESYPDTYKMHIYPSRRTASYPEWLVENTFNVAQVAELESDGNGVNNAKAAIPFPIPKNGLQVVWNHLLRYQGTYRVSDYVQVTPDTKGRYVEDKVIHYDYFPYYDRDRADDGLLMMFIAQQTAPAAVAGDSFLFHDYVNPKKNSRNIWRYFSGQRRVRRAPVFIYDTPIPPSYGYRTIDSFDMYFGAPDKYNWKLVGKKEIYIPYNNYDLQDPSLTVKEIATPFHISPEHARYELHRVWQVEGTLKDGQRHVYKKRTFWLDEDSWSITIADLYDERDQLWRVTYSYLMTFWDVPVVWTALEVHHDVVARRYNALPFMSEARATHDFSQKPPDDSFFTPASLRRIGAK